MADKNTFGVKVKTSYGEGVVRFRKERANAMLKREVSSEADPNAPLKEVLDHLESVEGFDDGQPITLDRIKAQDINEDLLSALLWAYYGYRTQLLTKEAAAKNFEYID